MAETELPPELPEQKLSWLQRLRRIFLGGARNPFDESIFDSLSLLPFFAWVGLGADGLSSSSYGPQEAWMALGTHHHLGVFVALGTVITVFVLSAGYSQIIEQFPTGGGGYLVASKLLNPTWGMISGCALLIDYVLTISISIAAGADAIFSFLPASALGLKFSVVVVGILALTLMNLRGVKESIGPMVPIFMTFVVTHIFGILWPLYIHMGDAPRVVADTARDVSSATAELGVFGTFFLVMKAYSMGAGTYTGIEAVSNGLNILREPRVAHGKRTMRYMAWSLSLTALGLILAYLLHGVQLDKDKTLNAILFQSISSGWGGFGKAFVWITLFSEAAILFIAAQAGFIGGPRVIANMALDRWLPSRFAVLSDRLVSQNGILVMSALALATLFLTHGSVAVLVVLYSINVFITFSLSMLGMVKHWWQVRDREPHWRRKLAVVAVGLFLTLFILAFVVFFKFGEGGWVTLLVTGSLVLVALWVKRHYRQTKQLLRRLDQLVRASEVPGPCDPEAPIEFDRKAKTAVLLVNGFNGLGMHTLLNIQRMFSGVYKNWIFVYVGVVDAGNFKGVEEMEALQDHVKVQTAKYARFMRSHGAYAEVRTSVGTDIISQTLALAPEILKSFPQSTFFGGQLVFPEDSLFTRFLHNNTVFALQRKLYNLGIPFVILPVRVY